jgi:DNA-binding transcriptional LysR family regulator
VISTLSLRYFAEVVQIGSIRAAAEQLHVAASAVGRQIAVLEEELGAPLIERGRGRTTLRLTSAGEILLRYIRKFDSELDHARSEIEALKGLRKGHIRLGIPETLVRKVIPDILMRFSKRYPGLTYDVQVHGGSPRLLELVSRDELDVAVTFNPPTVLHVKHLFERQLPTSVLMANDHPLAGKPFLKLSDCSGYGLAMPDESMIVKRDYDEMLAKARIDPRVVLVTNSYELLRSVAKAGLAITIVNAEPGEPATGPGYCYVPLKDPRVKPQRLTICTFDGRNPSSAVAVFIEHLKLEFDNLEFL